MTIQESTRRDVGAKLNPFRNVGGVRQSVAVAGTNATKTHRNFKWLPWYAGDISETTLTHDVLTGPMSGCTLISYRRNGAHQVGHIGTVDDPTGARAAVNAAVKAVWTNFMIAHPADVFGGFNPVAAHIPAFPPAGPDDRGGQTWGLFTTSGEFYSVQVQLQPVTATTLGVIPPTFKVVGVHLVHTMTVYALQNI